MQKDLSIVLTSDGSQTIRNNVTGDTYHSVHGAIQESSHVFIKHGLEYFIRTFPEKKVIRIFEVGLGTALNAWLTLQYVKDLKVQVEYVALEPYPLEKEIYSNLNYGEDRETLLRFHECSWNTPVEFSNYFKFTKHSEKIELAELHTAMFNVIYYDAFAPKSQPEMWSKEILEKIRSSMALPGIFVTYCAKGQVKRDLKELKLKVENPEGPPGKRSMLRAENL